ncbi:MAG: ATP-binding protein [Chitinivibrionales bacterium]|nr:ATP-binding protein [Chitinivibrionales bacterium]
MDILRPQENQIRRDLEKKIVFLVGPRQTGKTWLAKRIMQSFHGALYLNFDSSLDRETIRKQNWLATTPLIVFDEIHKMKKWKNYLKGVFDTRPAGLRILVTGSARLDTFRKGGDSLAGRFFRHRLLPLSVHELTLNKIETPLQRLIERGGFPEPLLAENPADADRWRQLYADGLIRIDILDFERIHNLHSMQLVFDLLRERVGSPVSAASIGRDVGISPVTVQRYFKILEDLYIVFRVSPFAKNIARSLLKEPKLYFYDTGMVRGGEGARFENAVAAMLLKHVSARQDTAGEDLALHYLNTKEGREVDFCIVKNRTVEVAIEAKLSEADIAPPLRYFHDHYGFPCVQLVKNITRERQEGTLTVLDASGWLKDLSA